MAGAASGVAVDDDCVSTFMDLKKKRKYRWVVYKIDGEKKVILEATGEPDVSGRALSSRGGAGLRGQSRPIGHALHWQCSCIKH
jgi:hypothetical protein